MILGLTWILKEKAKHCTEEEEEVEEMEDGEDVDQQGAEGRPLSRERRVSELSIPLFFAKRFNYTDFNLFSPCLPIFFFFFPSNSDLLIYS